LSPSVSINHAIFRFRFHNAVTMLFSIWRIRCIWLILFDYNQSKLVVIAIITHTVNCQRSSVPYGGCTSCQCGQYTAIGILTGSCSYISCSSGYYCPGDGYKYLCDESSQGCSCTYPSSGVCPVYPTLSPTPNPTEAPTTPSSQPSSSIPSSSVPTSKPSSSNPTSVPSSQPSSSIPSSSLPTSKPSSAPSSRPTAMLIEDTNELNISPYTMWTLKYVDAKVQHYYWVL